MIERLTKKQKEQIAIYRDKWVKIGLSTEPCNRLLGEKAIAKVYEVAGLAPPKIIWCGSPVGNILTKIVLEKKHSVRASVSDSVWESVRASVRDSVSASVSDWVWASVNASVWASVRDSISDLVIDSVRASVWESVRDPVWASVSDSVLGQHDAPMLAFYDYFREVCGLKKETERMSGLIEAAKNVNWFMPYQNCCFVSERHNICRLKDSRIHCDDGPAIAYPDGFEIYALNGVRVPKDIVMTPHEKLNPELILKESNVEIRREIVRKIGVERVISKLGAEVKERRGDYELLTFNLPQSQTEAKFLKMKNPSIGVYHIEGVDPSIETIEQALNWRVGGNQWSPKQLT